jgi:hypothetical protein
MAGMMRHRWMAAALLWTLGAASLAATNFWEAKAYTEWSEKEVEELLTDSPWARKLSVVIPIPPRAGGDDATGRGGGRGGDDGGGGRGFPVPSPQLKLAITWRSAMPVRQALIRLPNGASNAAVDQRPLLERPEFYIVTIAGVPARFSRATATAGTTSFLRRGKKMPIALAQGGLQQDGATLTLVFAFPRTDPITLDDKEVEFVTTLGTIEIKKKFSLKEMVVSGQLEL